jgi:GAF domain-containing protein
LTTKTPMSSGRDRRRSSVMDLKVAGREDELSGPGRDSGEAGVEDVLAEVFEEMQELFFLTDLQTAVDFVMDLALRKVPAEAGAILFADASARDLYFMTARGAKANEVLPFRVPMGQGIVGFACVEGMALAVSDVKRDKRFFREIAEKVRFDTRSILCAPIAIDGRSGGAIELINKTGTDHFTPGDVNVVSYMADQLGRWLKDNGG